MYEDREELLRKIRLGEDSSLELKEIQFRGPRIIGPHPRELADELAAMVNTAQGVLVLGVRDREREVVGIPLDRLDAVEELVRSVCNDSIEPPLAVRIHRMELADARNELQPVLKVDVPRSLFVHKSGGRYFQRIGSSKRELSSEQLARLFQQRSQARLIRFEEQIIPDAGFEDLVENLWRRFLGPFSDDPRTTLHKLKLLGRTEDGTESATVAGVLMCSWNPEQWLSSAIVEAVRYKGIDQDSNRQMDAQTLTGPLDEQIRGALTFVRRNMTVAATKEPERVEVPQFSIRAVFEAVVNAVAHRDYSIAGSKIRLFLFDDRLELYSPGALPNSVTVDSLALRQSTRNELLTTLLARCPVAEKIAFDVHRRFYMEKRGDGVPIILEESRALSGRVPEYRVIDDQELLLKIWSAELPNQPEA